MSLEDDIKTDFIDIEHDVEKDFIELERKFKEIVVDGMRLGRHVLHDVRSKDFPAPGGKVHGSLVHKSHGLPLNQGNLGSCTANALCGTLNTQPNTDGINYGEAHAIRLYEAETKLEGEPYPPNDPGGSGLEVCKAAQQMGWIESYTHAFSVEQALEALVLRPVITGINWYTSFDTPDENGLVAISADATVRGGHEVMAYGFDDTNELVMLWNSWGPSFGVGGHFSWSYDTWDKLLANQGDVTVPMAKGSTSLRSERPHLLR